MRGTRLVAAILGTLLHVAVGFLITVSGLVLPLPVVVALLVVWTAGFVMLMRWREHSLRVIAIPIATAGVWVVVAWFGDSVLGWTA